MTDVLVREHVEVQVRVDLERLISDSELAAMPPSPRRAPDMVARRAVGRLPHPVVNQGRAYRAWPILISLTPAAALIVAAGVIR